MADATKQQPFQAVQVDALVSGLCGTDVAGTKLPHHQITTPPLNDLDDKQAYTAHGHWVMAL